MNSLFEYWLETDVRPEEIDADDYADDPEFEEAYALLQKREEKVNAGWKRAIANDHFENVLNAEASGCAATKKRTRASYEQSKKQNGW